METIRKNIRKIWNSKCKYLVLVACALILANGVNFLQAGLKFLNENGEEVEEIKSVEIESDGWENREPGSWHVTKSAEWTGYQEATIKFELNTAKKIVVEKHEEEIEGVPSGADVILVLDTSGSMKTKDRLVHLKAGAKELVNEVLEEENHKIALISFNQRATLRSSFTNDKSQLINQINGLSPSGNTSFVNAYKEVISLLSGYNQSENRDLVMVFLTDGSAVSAKAQYKILKDKYDITIVGIQYDMGSSSSIKKAIIDMTDKQYLANTSNIKNILYQSVGESTTRVEVTQVIKTVDYEIFEIEDDITKDFYVRAIDDIQVSRGEVSLETMSDGKQKVIWTVTKNDGFSTGNNATMIIKTHYQGELNNNRVYQTNSKEVMKVKLKDESETITESELTPQLRVGYNVTYDSNLPKECNSSGEDLTTKEYYFAYEERELPKNEYTCSGWQFKGWGFQPEDIATVDNKFIMPDSDIKVAGIWTKIDISKNMDGTIALPAEPAINYELSYLKSSNTDVKITSGETYSTTLIPTNTLLYGRPSSIQVYMNGSLITNYTYNNVNGNLSIPNVIGDLKIIATADVLSNENISFERPKVLGNGGIGTISYVAVTQARQLRIFSFTPTVTKSYTFYSNDSNASVKAVDPYAYLLTESDTVTIETLDAAAVTYATSGSYADLQNQALVYNDDGGEGYNFKMTYNCQAGKTYYLVIRTYTTDKIQTFYNIIIQ